MPDAAPLRLASYNIRAGLGTDLRRDPERVLGTIAALSPDVIALQEADFRLGDRPSALPGAMIEDMTGLLPLPFGRSPGSLGWHGIALLARPGIETLDLHKVDLPGLEPRGAVIADLGAGDWILRVVGVHLGLLRSSRRLQLDHIRRILTSLPTRPTVILGDFNEWSRVRGLGRIARDYRIVTPHRTYPSRLPLFALDRIAHSPDLSVRLMPAPPATHPHPSDHLPVLAEVQPIRKGGE